MQVLGLGTTSRLHGIISGDLGIIDMLTTGTEKWTDEECWILALMRSREWRWLSMWGRPSLQTPRVPVPLSSPPMLECLKNDDWENWNHVEKWSLEYEMWTCYLHHLFTSTVSLPSLYLMMYCSISFLWCAHMRRIKPFFVVANSPSCSKAEEFSELWRAQIK